MTELFINPDGAGPQAQAVLAYLRQNDGIECSYNAERYEYSARPKVDRWYNGREQGYVVHMKSANYQQQINIAFFEHRNSDAICAVEWEKVTSDPPVLSDTDGADIYKNKYDTSFDVSHGEAEKMADWIYSRLIKFWKSNG